MEKTHDERCMSKHALNEQAADGTWSATCVRCGHTVYGYATRSAADCALFFGEDGPEAWMAYGFLP